MIYFASDGRRDSPIKIGFSCDPEARCRRLERQIGRPLGVSAVMPGGIVVEESLHRRFADGRLRGEWFAADTPGLRELISDVLHFEGFWPEDTESPGIRRVLAVLAEVGYVVPAGAYADGWE